MVNLIDTTSATATNKEQQAQEPAQQKLVHAVFEGGGVRGIGHVGALKVAEDLGYRWDHVAGTSAGAIVAALIAAGYSAAELYQIMTEIDYKQFADGPKVDMLHAAEGYNMLWHGGMYPGNYVQSFVSEHLAARNIKTFGDLIDKDNLDNPNQFMRYRLTVIASDITTGRMLRIPQDLKTLYGSDPDTFEVARAVRMSASYPFFFIPMPLQDKVGMVCRIVDGGLLSNFPLFLFEEQRVVPDRPTLGFRLVNPAPPIDSAMLEGSNSVVGFVKALIDTMLSAHDKLYMDDSTYVRTISIPTGDVASTQFDLSPEQVTMLYQNGQKAARKFFLGTGNNDGWNFEAYKAVYANGQAPTTSRIQNLHANMNRISQKLA